MGFLLSEVQLAELRTGEDSHYCAVFLYSFHVSLGVVLALVFLLVSLGIVEECFLLCSLPVLIESSLEFIRNLLSPDGRKCSQSSGGFNVTNETNNLHGWAFNDGDRFNDIFLDDLLSFSLLVMSSNVSHTSFVTNEGCQVDWLLGVILGE